MQAQPGTTNPAVDTPIPWETKEGGFFEKLGRTIILVLLRPKTAFIPPLAVSPLPALYFGIMLGLFGPLVSNLWDMILVRDGGVEGAFFIVIVLAQTALTLLLGTALCHMFLWVFQGAHRRFSTTFRVMCYCQAASVLFVVPYLGELVGSVWSLVLLVIGLAVAHGTNWVRSLLSVVCSLIVVFLFAGLFVAG